MMDVTFRPAARNARMAASRPPPGPFTLTSMLLNPSAMASSAAFLADSVAANGVLFREPKNPKFRNYTMKWHSHTYPSRLQWYY